MDRIGVLEVTFAALGVLATVLIYRRQRVMKRLAVALLTNRSLLSYSTPFAVELAHGAIPLDYPRLTVVRIGNIGNAAIPASDYEDALTLSFPTARIVSADVTASNPADLRPALSISDAALTFEPCLLNPGDIIEIQMLVDGRAEALGARARVAGVPKIEHVRLPRTSWDTVWRVDKFDMTVMGGGTVCLIVLVGLSAAMKEPILVAMAVAGLLVWSAWSIRTLRVSRAWLTLAPPQGH